MRYEIEKELRYAFRSGRLIILASSFMFFALLTPLMLKVVLPQILSGSFAAEPSLEIKEMMNMTQIDCIQSYMGDVFEIGTVIVSFTLSGLMASEIRNNTLVIPICSGKKFKWIVGAKLAVFGILLVLVTVLSLFADYIYSGMLFSFEIGPLPILYGGLLQGTYMIFLISCLIMWGSIMKNPIATGFLTLVTAYGIHFLSGLFRITEYTPSGLLLEAQRLTLDPSKFFLVTVIITFVSITSMIFLTLFRLKEMEWNERSS